MERKNIIFLIIFLAIAVFVMPKVFYKISKNIQVNGNRVVIDYGKHHIVAETQPEDKESFLVNNGSASKLSDAWFWVIPMGRVKELKEQYGDFTHCGSAGASAAQDSLCRLFLFAANPVAERKIKEVIKYSRNSPIIEIKAFKLNIAGHTYKQEKYEPFDPSSPELYYLVNDVTLIKERYQ